MIDEHLHSSKYRVEGISKEEKEMRSTDLDVSTDEPVVVDCVIGFCRHDIKGDVVRTTVSQEGYKRGEVDVIRRQVQSSIRRDWSIG